jgi:hypothetical protein
MGTDLTGRKTIKGRFKPGQSGNPAGRPRGARSRLNEAFWEAIRADFEKHGVRTIETVRETMPDKYLAIVAKDPVTSVAIAALSNPLDEWSNEKLDRAFEALDAMLAREAETLQ